MTNTAQNMTAAFKAIRGAQYTTDRFFFAHSSKMDNQTYFGVMDEYKAVNEELTKHGCSDVRSDFNKAAVPTDVLVRYFKVQDKKLAEVVKHMSSDAVMNAFMTFDVNEEMVKTLEKLGIYSYAKIFKAIVEEKNGPVKPGPKAVATGEQLNR